jgi:low temperature requirement protein LtrA
MSTTAFVFAFTGIVALWWIYFNRAAEDSAAAIGAADDPGRLGRSAYAYFHLPMVAGIILVAVADDLTVAHPGGPGRLGATAVILGGPALFLAGHALFKWTVFGVVSVPRVVAIVALAVLIPVGQAVPPFALLGLATASVGVVAIWDTWRHPAIPASAPGQVRVTEVGDGG